MTSGIFFRFLCYFFSHSLTINHRFTFFDLSAGLRTFTSSNPRLLRAQGFDFVLPLGIEYNHESSVKEAEEEVAQEMLNSKRSGMQDARFGGETIVTVYLCVLVFR